MAESGYRIFGKVTFQGKPVPAGKTLFSLDTDEGGAPGPTGYADIKDVRAYDTAPLPGGRASLGGPMIAGDYWPRPCG